MSLVARVGLPLTAASRITIWDGDTTIQEIDVPLSAVLGGNWPLVRIIKGLKALGYRMVDARKERPIVGGSEFDVERLA